jgi:hypothetical protein
LQDSRVENNVFYTLRGTRQDENYTWPKQKAYTDGPMVVVEKYSRRNTFELPSREALDLRGDAKSNAVTALADDLEEKVPPIWKGGQSPEVPGFQGYIDGRRRTYADPDSSGSLMNLGLTNVFKINRARRGDVAMHDGTDFADGQARLALFDGTKWVFFKPEEVPKR